MHQKGYVIYCPGSRSIIISADVIFDELFSTAIAHTWQKYHSRLAWRPLLSHIPDIDTKLEQTGSISTTVVLDELEDPPDLMDMDNDDASTIESEASDDDGDDANDTHDDDHATLLLPADPEPEIETPQILGPTWCRSSRIPKPDSRYASIATTEAWVNFMR
jgi:hypothetical protein